MAGNSSTLATINTAFRARTGAPTGGVASLNGNGATTAFTIAHGQSGTPTNYWVAPVSEHSWGKKSSVTANGTNITVTFATAPVSGTGNVKVRWGASRL